MSQDDLVPVDDDEKRGIAQKIKDGFLNPVIHVGVTFELWFLLTAISFVLLSPTEIIDGIYFLLVSVAYIPFSFLFVTFLCYLCCDGETLAQRPLSSLRNDPDVAVLYTTYNDIMPIALEETEEAINYPADLWILSDSDEQEAIETEQSFAWWTRYTRENGRGGKCGIINDWLSDHGDEYEYYISLDADSILAEGNIEELVSYAEHESNQDVAIFQTLMSVHPSLVKSSFGDTLGKGVQWSTRFLPFVMKEVHDQNTYWGSNGLVRIEAIESIGGYNEQLLCEDFVLTTELDIEGWTSLIVDEYSYEGFPSNLLILRDRTVRWVRANREMFSLLFTENVSLGTRLNCLTPLTFYAVTPVLLLLLVLPLFFSIEGISGKGSMVFGLFVFGFIFAHRVFAARQEPVTFFKVAVLETFAILGMSLRVSYALLVTNDEWTPCDKGTEDFGWIESFRLMVPEIGVGLIILYFAVSSFSGVSTLLTTGVWSASFLSGPLFLRYMS